MMPLRLSISLILFAVPVASACAQSVDYLDHRESQCLPRLSVGARQLELYLKNGLRLVYRDKQTGSDKAFFLTSNANLRDNCGAKNEMTIYAKLPLTELPDDQWLDVNFDCENSSKTIMRHRPLIGVFSKTTHSLPSKTLDAWTVDFHKKSFIKTDNAYCYSFS